MISHITDVIIKDKKIITQQTEIAALEQEVRNRENEAVAFQKRIDVLERS